MSNVWTIFQEDDGRWSAARVISFLATVSTLLINLIYCIRNNQLPEGGEVMKELIGANLPYVINKISTVVKR